MDDDIDEPDEIIEISGTADSLTVNPTRLTLEDNDMADVQLSIDPAEMGEEDGATTVLVTATRNILQQRTTIELTLRGTASADDYAVTGTLSITIPAGSESGTTRLIFGPVDDTIDEPDETIEISGLANGRPTSTTALTLIDNDDPPTSLTLTVRPDRFNEDDSAATAVTVTATLDGSTTFALPTSVALSLGGTASADDYSVEGTLSITIPAGAARGTTRLTFNPIQDLLKEGDETIEVSGSLLGLTVMPAVITLVDDDGEVLTVSFAAKEYTANEFGGPARVTLTVTPDADRPISVVLRVTLQGGASQSDYSGLPMPAAMVFKKGASVATIEIQAEPDDVHDPGESLLLQIGEPPNKVEIGEIPATTVRLVQQRQVQEFAEPIKTTLALTARAWAESAQRAIEARFDRHRQTEEGWWMPTYYEPEPGAEGWSALPGPFGGIGSWRERRNMGLIRPRLSLNKVLKSLKGWRPVLWSQLDTQHFSSPLWDHQGNMNAVHFGLDVHSGKRTLLGVSLMRGKSEVRYAAADDIQGETRSTLYSFHPYLHFQAHERFSLWTLGGVGRGPVTASELDRKHNLQSSGKLIAGGVRALAHTWGDRELGVRADANLAGVNADLPDETIQVGGYASRVRVLAEVTQTLKLGKQSLHLSGEAGGRLDRGQAERGGGLETGARVSWRNPRLGLDLTAHGNTLLWHQADYQSWGAGVQASWDSGADRRGWIVTLASSRGQGSGRTTAFERTLSINSMNRFEQALEVSYGRDLWSGLLTATIRLRQGAPEVSVDFRLN